MALFDANPPLDSQMARYVETLSSTITRLTKAIEVNEAKVAANENNYIQVVRRINELENENKELRKNSSQYSDKVRELENSLSQQKRSFEEAEGRLNRRLMDCEGEIKELSRRIDRQGRTETEGKITGAAELQLVQTRLQAVQEETRLTVENGKRWADQERERLQRELTDNIRNIQANLHTDVKDLQAAVDELEDKTRIEIDNNQRSLRRSDDKIKQIIERIKTNEGRYREKHQGHKTDNAHVQHELETNLEKITTTVDHLSQVLNGKITLLERQFKADIAQLKKLVVLADS